MAVPAGVLGEAAPDGREHDAAVNALSLVLRRRVDGLLSGDHLSKRTGPGLELAQIRPYEVGDDLRFIDWSVTARTSEPHVRIHVADRALVSWLLLDTSPSMRFGTADRTKAAVAEGAALVLGQLACRGANRLGALTFGGAREATVAPSQGRRGLVRLLAALRDSGATPDGVVPPATALADAADRIARTQRPGGLIVVISDFRDQQAWAASLQRLASRHDVAAIEVRDQREESLPALGPLDLIDPETGRRLRVDTGRRDLRERFAEAAAADRASVASAITSAGADHLVLRTDGDWFPPLAAFLLSRRHVSATRKPL